MAPEITTFDLLMVAHAGEYTHAIVLELLAAERERCAKIAELQPDDPANGCECGSIIAEEIRRGK